MPHRRLVSLLALAALLASGAARAQDVPADTLSAGDEDATFEALLEDGVDGDPEVLLEALQGLRDNPLDVNTATAPELAVIPAFSAQVASAITRYREANGPFGSLPELQLVDGVTEIVYRTARPYLTIGPTVEVTTTTARRYPVAPSLRTVVRGLRVQAIQRLQRRLDTPAGYLGPDSTRTYAGSPDRVYTRLQATYRRQVSINLTLEKDPGEAFRFDSDTNTYGYDYLSGHVAVLDAGRIDALVVGDFIAEFGQGVALWRASGFGKGPDAVGGPTRTGRGIRPYGSVDENNFFRGAALTLAVTPRVYATGFASRRRLDASVFRPDTLDLADPDLPPDAFEGSIVTGLAADGLHRTAGELARKDALGETLVGGGLEYRLSTSRVDGRAGVVATQGRYDTPIGMGTRPDNRFNFAGDQATTVSVYADARTRAGQAFGEATRGPGGGFGAVGGVSADLGGGADVLVVGRHYGRDFTSLHGYPFGERNGVGQNETGLYLGARVRPSRAWALNAYVDQYRFDWLRFNVPRPSVGREALVHIEHRPTRYARGYLQARSETKEASRDVPNVVPGSVVGGLVEETRQTLRLHGEWDATRTLRFRSRVEGSRFSPAGQPASTGALVYQDVRVQVLRGLRLDGRLTLFRTDDYDARLYAFENDLSGVFSIPPLYGRGVRGYVLLRAEPASGLVVEAKLSSTWLRGVRRIGSGAQQVDGDRVRDLGLQVRYRF